MNRKMALGFAAFALVSVGAAWIAKAGTRYWDFRVSIDLTNRSAAGQMGGVRDNGDDISFIGCHTWGNNNSSYLQMVCQARDANGTYVSCWSAANNSWWGTSQYPAVLDQVRTIKGDSGIVFNWDANGNCTYLSVEQYSFHAPKVF
jgi:hypothetical protein